MEILELDVRNINAIDDSLSRVKQEQEDLEFQSYIDEWFSEAHVSEEYKGLSVMERTKK